MKRAAFVLSCALLAAPGAAMAEGGPGSSFGESLRLAITARTMALGGAHAASSDGVHALAANPAGMMDSAISTFHVTHTFYVSEIDKDYIAYTQHLPGGGALGFSLFWMRSATAPRTLEDENGNWAGEAGEYTISSGSASVGLSAKLSGIVGFDYLRPTGGAAVRMFRQQVDQDRIFKMTADFGVKIRPTDDITVGAVLQNYSTKLAEASAPTQLVAAAAWRTEALLRDSDSLTVELDLPTAVDGPMTFALGSEYTLLVGSAGLAARLGFKRGVDTEGTSGLTSGLGYRWLTGSSPWGIDYAFIPFGEFGSVHSFSLTFCLGR